MLEDGIAFGAYDSVKDSFEASFIEDSILDKIAKKIRKLIVECNAYPRFQDQLLLWDKRHEQQLAAEDKWCRRREKYERQVIMQGRLLDEAAGPPELDWCFERFRYKDLPADSVNVRIETAIMLGAWFPPELCSHNCPEVELPLPPRKGDIEISAKCAALSAIYDYRMKGQRGIGAGLDLNHYDLLLGIKSPIGERDGLVAQIFKADECHLWTWLDDVERDLQAWAAEAADQVNDKPALAKSAACAYEILLALPPYRAMKAPEIVSKLYDEHKINIDESTFRKNVVPALTPYGLEHEPAGYRIKPNRRRPQ